MENENPQADENATVKKPEEVSQNGSTAASADGEHAAEDGIPDPTPMPLPIPDDKQDEDTQASNVQAEVEGPPPIEGDEELEGANDGYVKELALAHGIEYVDRADAIGKLKVRRDSVLPAARGQANPV